MRADSPLVVQQVATPAQPSSGFNKLYPKSDGKWYSSTPTVAETLLTPMSAYSTADQGVTSVGSLTDLTSLGIAVPAGTWIFRWTLFYITSLSTIGAQVAINGPTLTSMAMAVWTQKNTTNTLQGDAITAYNTASTAATGLGTATVLPIYVEGIATVSAAGTLQLRAQSSATGTITFKLNSFGQVWAA